MMPAGMAAQPPSAAIARRLVKMGLSPALPVFPPGSISLLQLVPWWRLWAADPRLNTLKALGAGVLPAAASGVLNLRRDTPIGQAIFAAMLPIHHPETAVEDWTRWIITSIVDETCSGPSPLLGVLEHLLGQRAETERVQVWMRILECPFGKNGKFCRGNEAQVVALLEAVGRTGLRVLAPSILGVLQCEDAELVLAAIACLARLGLPDVEMPAEVLMNRLHPENVECSRWALAFLETGDLDLLSALLRCPSWGERVQTLRIVEAVLARGGPAAPPADGWLGDLTDLLLAQLQQDEDRDAVRCMAVTLGLTLRQAGEVQMNKALDLSARLTEQSRFECTLDALLIAGLPASAGSRVEELRPLATKMDSQATLNRVLMSLGLPSGDIGDWLHFPVVIFRQLGVLQLPPAIAAWWEAPGECPEAPLAALLKERPDSGIIPLVCAAYLVARPESVQTLEQIWVNAACRGESETIRIVGSLLAGAANDCTVSPVELRCCLGHEIGGPLEESPEMGGRLLGLLTTQSKEVRQAAEELLLFTSQGNRIIAGGCLRWKHPAPKVFGEARRCRNRLGVTTTPLRLAAVLPPSLQPLLLGPVPLRCPPKRLLEALALPDRPSKDWVRACVNWNQPEAVKAALSEVDATVLAASFLQASASGIAESRQLAGLLAAGVGLRLLETSHRDLVTRRVIFLAAHDPDATSREAGVKAARALGLADKLPITPPPPPTTTKSAAAVPESEPSDTDIALEDLLRDLEGDLYV